jgi:hypothetical protein
MEEDEVEVAVKWNGAEYSFTLNFDETVSDLKRHLGGASQEKRGEMA